jgi:ABC-type multidrug transport system ATPase subunit
MTDSLTRRPAPPADNQREAAPPPLPRPALAVHGLAKTYPGGVEAVRGIDLEVAPGEVVGLLGPNGAGKTTTVGMLTGIVAPTRGRAELGGHDVVAEPRAARAVSAVVFQDAVVDRALTGRRNLETHGRLWGVPRPDVQRRIEEQAREFGVADILDRPVGTYSGGQRRRLELARALLSRPQVLFLDEPTVGLDPRIRFEIVDILARMRRKTRMTVLLTTHYLDEAERLCDRVAIMHEGLVVALDSPANLLAGLGTDILDLRVDGPDGDGDGDAALAALAAAGLAGPDAFRIGDTVSVPLRDRTLAEAVAALDRLGLPNARLGTRRPTLDDVYLRLTGARIAA